MDQASYNPVFKGGKPFKVVKFAADITAAKKQAVEDSGKLQAISRSQAVIEFTPKGEILTANENFCKAMGYSLAEITGKHHSIFCEPAYVSTEDYSNFWRRLANGEFIANEFVRFGKDGREIWIQAAYNPIVDADGKIYKVVKFATDVTQRMSAISLLGGALRQLSEGDLTRTLDTPFVPSMEQLRQDFNTAIKDLAETMKTIGENASAIAAGSREIGASADSFSKRTEQQAASVEETAAALEEITTTVNDSSRRADEAGRLVAMTKQAPSNPVSLSAMPSPLWARSNSPRARSPTSSASSTISPSDQPPGIECRRRGGPRRRNRQGLRRGGPGGAGAGPALRQSCQGDQGADQHVGRACQERRRPRRPDW